MTTHRASLLPLHRQHSKHAVDEPIFRSREERITEGRALRVRVPRQSHANWPRTVRSRDPIQLLQRSNAGRLPDLVPIRFGRMLTNPFTFLRGAAGLMAHDLAKTPASGVRSQLCGDCHLLNFGLFASTLPKRACVRTAWRSASSRT